MTYRELRVKTHDLFSPHEGGVWGRRVDWFILTLIAVNVLAITLETVGELEQRFATMFYVLEVVSVAIFTIEYVARVWSAIEEDPSRRPVIGRLRYASRPLLIIDLVAILPFYLTALGVGLDLRFLRALRLMRVFRLFRVAGYSEAVGAFIAVLRERKEKLVIAVTANLLLLLVASSIMYYVEHPAQPDTFNSIPATLWWGVATLTTVGYGDVVPVTVWGQLIGGVVAILGIGMFAIPAALIATGFVDAARLEGRASGPHESNGNDLPPS